MTTREQFLDAVRVAQDYVSGFDTRAKEAEDRIAVLEGARDARQAEVDALARERDQRRTVMEADLAGMRLLFTQRRAEHEQILAQVAEAARRVHALTAKAAEDRITQELARLALELADRRDALASVEAQLREKTEALIRP